MKEKNNIDGDSPLTLSDVKRQNILNNTYAVQEIQKATNIRGIEFEGQIVLLREQVAQFFGVDVRTVSNYIDKFSDELQKNGYEVLRGKRLKQLKLCLKEFFGKETDFLTKTTVLGIFDFRAFLNLAMLLQESEVAKLLRQTILDIVIDTLNVRTGGGTKYINQRDEDFILAYYEEENYRRIFTDSLKDCVAMGNFKYPLYTDKIYNSIFKENAKEYRNILKLHSKDKVRETFYSEILDLVSSYEYGFAQLLIEKAKTKERRLYKPEVDALFDKFEKQSHWKPLLEKARIKMASRDLAFRDAMHHQLKEYITPVQREEFERFIGEKSKELAERLEETKDVFQRLKECE
jgi:hypothetical protein